MITIKRENNESYQVDMVNQVAFVNGTECPSDWLEIGKDKYHVIIGDRSYTIEKVSVDDSGKQLTLMVNGQKQLVQVEDRYDALLKQLGMDKLVSNKANDVKAPMPGLVLRLLVSEGQTVKKGDALLVLEAMKMENIIKSAGDGTVKHIKVEAKQAVDKNQVMLVME